MNTTPPIKYEPSCPHCGQVFRGPSACARPECIAAAAKINMREAPRKTTMPEKIIAGTRWLNLVERDGWTYVARTSGPDVVVIVAVTKAGNLLLVEQPRPPVGRSTIELPAGVVGDNGKESILAAADRELVEETGYKAAQLSNLGRCAVSPGLTDEMVNVCVAIGLTKVGDGGGLVEEGEKIRVHEVPFVSAPYWLENQTAERNVYVAASVYTGLYLAFVKTAGIPAHIPRKNP